MPCRFRHAIQVEIVGQDGGLVVARVGDQLGIDLVDLRIAGLADLHRADRVTLEGGQHFQSAPSTISAQGVR